MVSRDKGLTKKLGGLSQKLQQPSQYDMRKVVQVEAELKASSKKQYFRPSASILFIYQHTSKEDELEIDQPYLSWDDFDQQCNLRFGPPTQ
ncbi:conserved hypothetical protein [Ricinus communis]|uniref:Uncharacterized protein n=1 Tax=Ricinus communis TaxID=3988 RepID=B9S9F9_RICCO|nr:conserved hypothetical protein [Ricinus communis]